MIPVLARVAPLGAVMAAALLIGTPQAFSPARIINIGECPLDTITFVDPWAGGEFKIERVGTNYLWLCGSGAREEPPVSADCMGPYGELVLQGMNRKYEGQDAQPVFAVWTVSKAAPCCGWYVADGDDIRVLGELRNFRWLSEDEMPKIGDLPFASIDSDELISNDDFGAIFGNPKVAMMCELPPE